METDESPAPERELLLDTLAIKEATMLTTPTPTLRRQHQSQNRSQGATAKGQEMRRTPSIGDLPGVTILEANKMIK
jgi:hypothetical protein